MTSAMLYAILTRRVLQRVSQPKKEKEKGDEFIICGPDWLWCIDGHGKFRNCGIGIYAAVDAFF